MSNQSTPSNPRTNSNRSLAGILSHPVVAAPVITDSANIATRGVIHNDNDVGARPSKVSTSSPIRSGIARISAEERRAAIAKAREILQTEVKCDWGFGVTLNDLDTIPLGSTMYIGSGSEADGDMDSGTSTGRGPSEHRRKGRRRSSGHKRRTSGVWRTREDDSDWLKEMDLEWDRHVSEGQYKPSADFPWEGRRPYPLPVRAFSGASQASTTTSCGTGDTNVTTPMLDSVIKSEQGLLPESTEENYRSTSLPAMESPDDLTLSPVALPEPRSPEVRPWLERLNSGISVTQTIQTVSERSPSPTLPPPSVNNSVKQRRHHQDFLEQENLRVNELAALQGSDMLPSQATGAQITITRMNPYRFENPNSIGFLTKSTTASRIKTRKMQSFQDELTWNSGLRLWTLRRDAWTGIDEDGYIKVGESKFNDNTLFNHITPQKYGTIYNKLVEKGVSPNVPINLRDITKALVHGWREGGEWPPPNAPPEPSFAKRKTNANGKSSVTSKEAKSLSPGTAKGLLVGLKSGHGGPGHFPDAGRVNGGTTGKGNSGKFNAHL